MKSIYVLLGLGVLVAGGAAAVFLTRDSESVDVTAVVPASEIAPAAEMAPVDESVKGNDTFANLFKLGKSLECTFTFKDSATAVATEGTGFFDGTHMRVDSMYRGVKDVTYTSSLISNGTTMYIWSETEQGPMAMKMAVPKEGVTGSTEPVDRSKGGLNPQSKVNYDCKPWNVDGSVFVPPADITFMDMNSMMNGMMKDLPAGMKQPTS